MEEQASLTPEQTAKLIKQAKSAVVLSGAGISTAAGIPDFRGPRGLYVTRAYDPNKVFDIDWFYREPNYFYEFSRDFVGTVSGIEPTFTHKLLARLEQEGHLAAIITQNIDLLHHQAGNRNILEIHGSYNNATCPGCQTAYTDLDYQWWMTQMKSAQKPPVVRCAKCHSVLKPDIVFFGEMVHGYQESQRLVAGCDLLLVLGSSLQVAPASQLPYAADAPVVVINKGEVMLPAGPDRYFVDADLDEYFREVATWL